MAVDKSLSRKEFDILDVLIAASEKLSQRQIQDRTEYSLSTINRTLKTLIEKGYVNDGLITTAGLDAMKPYKVKRAIFIAAGFGTRLLPITLNTPKPMVRVKGIRIIDRMLDACIAAGIEEIYIVRGYLSEQFDQLLYKYPTIKFIDNPDYNETNNISSVVCTRHLLDNTYVLEADILVSDGAAHRIIKKYQYTSNTLAIKRDRTDDWCFMTKDNVIISQQVGGIDCYQEIGISYLSEDDGKRLSEHMAQAYEMPGGKELFWDQVQLSIFKNQYRIEVRPCREEDVVEIDTFKELKAVDKAYDIR